MKTTAARRKVATAGGELVDWIVTFTSVAYNLVRLSDSARNGWPR